MSDITWGPAIEVGGVRPAWLGDDERVDVRWSGDWYSVIFDCDGALANCIAAWPEVFAIRLKSNHPHYRTEKPAEAPLGVLTGVERVERLEALVGRLAKTQYYSAADQAEARALCPEPEVDLDLLKAREIVVRFAKPYAKQINEGEWDDNTETRIALAGIKRGRALAGGDRS